MEPLTRRSLPTDVGGVTSTSTSPRRVVTMRRSFVLVAAGLTLALGACSSGGSSKSSDTTAKKSSDTTAKNSSGSFKAIDACGLASDAEVAKLGASGPAKAFERPQVPGVQWGSCTWGSITSGQPVVIIQTVQLQDAPVDALSILLKAGDTAKNPATNVSVGNDGKLYNVAILAGGGGGGVGKTIAFTTDNGTRVAVSVTGDNPNVAELTALANSVDAKVD